MRPRVMKLCRCTGNRAGSRVTVVTSCRSFSPIINLAVISCDVLPDSMIAWIFGNPWKERASASECPMYRVK